MPQRSHTSPTWHLWQPRTPQQLVWWIELRVHGALGNVCVARGAGQCVCAPASHVSNTWGTGSRRCSGCRSRPLTCSSCSQCCSGQRTSRLIAWSCRRSHTSGRPRLHDRRRCGRKSRCSCLRSRRGWTFHWAWSTCICSRPSADESRTASRRRLSRSVSLRRRSLPRRIAAAGAAAACARGGSTRATVR